MLRFGLVGFGGIAKTHRKCIAMLEALGLGKLVCAYDVDPEAFTRNVAINIDVEGASEEKLNLYTDLDEMLEKEDIDVINVCIPTYEHKDMTIKLLRRGYHVLCEKPMALNYADCLEMIAAARESGRELMIGQCVRFYPHTEYIKAAVDDGRFGKVIGAVLQRLSGPPVWGWHNWFMNPEKSGGCLTDMHVHDVDYVRYLFGEPDSVSCTASTSVSVYDSVHSNFHYDSLDNAPIVAIGDWSLSGTKFSAPMRVNFERATVIYDGKVLTVYPKDGGEQYEVELENYSGHFGEMRYFCDVIEGRCKNTRNPAESAATTIKLVECLRRSVAQGGEVVKFDSEEEHKYI